jgi:hypothetical protein
MLFLNGFYIGGLNELEIMDVNGQLKILLADRQRQKKTPRDLISFMKSYTFTGFIKKKIKFNRIN